MLKFFAGMACWIGAVILFVNNIFSKSGIPTVPIVALLVLGLILIITCARPSKKQRQAMQAQLQQAAQQNSRPAGSADQSDNTVKTIEFNVAGVSYKNDDGTSRQDILRALRFGDEPYASASGDMDVDIEETTYNEETAFEVHINGYLVGFVPKAKVSQVKKAMDTFTCTADSARIIGGGKNENGEDRSFGCVVTLTYMD